MTSTLITPPSLATDVAGIRTRMARFQSDQGAAVCAAFRARADDVFIATYPKCGTTWMQQIVHSLRTGGDMAFEEITAVVPWLELAYDLGQDPSAEQSAVPRAFKTHLDGDRVPSGARYIYIIRDPRDVVVSFHHFFEGWVFEPGSISLETFAREFFIAGSGSGNYWQHLASWWPRHDDHNTLMFSYEEMLRDSAGTIDSVARFISIDDAEACEVTRNLASFQTMRQHAHRFDDNLVRRHRNAACGLPSDATTTKVRRGQAGADHELLSTDTLAAFDVMWRRWLSEPLGVSDYQMLCGQLRSARQRLHGS